MSNRRLVLIGSALASAIALGGPLAASANAATPGTVSRFPTLAPSSAPSAITAGPDGELWFTDIGANAVGVIDPVTQKLTEFPTPTASSNPLGIVTGPDGKLWFAEQAAQQIGMIDPSTHSISELPAPGPVAEIAASADGGLWFTDPSGKLGTIDPTTHAIAEFPLPAPALPVGIVSGPDGNLWFTDTANGAIGEFNPVTRAVSEFPVNNGNGGADQIVVGPDGNLWFTEGAHHAVGNINPTTHQIAEFQIPNTSVAGIATGPDGNVWFTEVSANKVGMINPVTHQIAEFATGTTTSPAALVTGADGNLWLAGSGDGSIDSLVTGHAAAPLTNPSIQGGGQTGVSQACTGELWTSFASQSPSTSLDPFDGVHWLRDGTQIATGPNYTPTETDAGHQLSCTVTATYPLLSLTAIAASPSLTVNEPSQPSAIPNAAPGPSGVERPQGPQPTPGVTGRRPTVGIRLVTCVSKTTPTPPGQRCTTKLIIATTALPANTVARARLSHRAHIVGAGVWSHDRLELTVKRSLRPGTYSLTLHLKHHTTTFTLIIP